MHVVLVRPPMPYLINPHMYGPIGLWSLAEYVERELPDTTVDVVELPGEIPVCDVLGWTATSIDYHAVLALASYMREKHPDIVQVIGGPHVSATRSLDVPFDAAFVGEGERSFAGWLSWLREGKLRRGVFHPDPVEDLDELPYPRRPYLEERTTIVGSRGCPYKCAFCATQTLWQGFRSRSARGVAAEMIHLSAFYGVEEFNLSDDTPWLFRAQGEEFVDILHDSGFKWRAQARVNEVVKRPRRLATLRAAGCDELCMGVESFDQRVLDALRKGTRVEQIEEAVHLVNAAGFRVRAYLMIGTPGESARTVDLNMASLEALGNAISVVNLQPFMPLPGTPIWEDPAAFGCEIVDADVSKYNRYLQGPLGKRPTWSPINVDGMSHGELLYNIERMRRYIEEK